MPNRQLPLNDTDFWWLRYVLGIAVPVVLTMWGIYSIVTRHSYAIWALRYSLRFVPVEGKQAILMGVAYLGIAIILFANCYAQYHDKMGFYYQWILAPGVIMAGGGIFWCGSIFLFGS
ncbi:MAG TPA: hypothetical protein VGZ93_06685 [Candidatus Methylacidiphilales bacterium]|jgi:hypothetical protein|nr:hypothetical protein [Candidatus Methylacidiphilales bacterium]